ncbi:signal peptide peptidase SppA [Novosphingobium sp.]|uniref:signal peptide peptidase SppA n=1 Tax=Novosphingobium sp. TaxID=1874826 RepID=UPI0035B4719C
MIFARKVWHLFVAIKDALVLLFMLLFFFGLYALLTVRPSVAQLHDGALLLKLDGAVVEEPAMVDPLSGLVSGDTPAKEYAARDVVRALKLAASDDHVKAVVFDLSRFTGGGLVHMEEIGAAMDEVRAAKKPVLTYAVGYTDDGVMLAAHASEAWVDPIGGAFVMGPGGQSLYYGALLERLKVKAHVFRVGTYKDFVEPYLRTGQSEPAKQARTALYGAVWEDWQANVAKARPKANLKLVTSDPVGWIKASGGDAAKAALSAGLIDRIGDEVAFGERVKALAGADNSSSKPGGFAHFPMSTLLAAHPLPHEGKAVAVVTVAGEIVDGKAGPGSAGGDRIVGLIDEANADGAAALVLRVDSPGGSVLASERIRLALERFKASGRPVIVSMANLAASGGYWVSTPASKIFAEPGTITGSIGIFAIIPTFEGTLANYGVNSDGVRTTPLSGQPDLLTGLTPEAEAMLQANIENGYARFIGLVAKSRGKTPQQIDAIAQGRVWDGGTARQIGLVDQFGGLADALEFAASSAKLESWHPVFYGTKVDPLGSLLERFGAGEDEGDQSAQRDFAGIMAARQNQLLGRVSQDLGRLLSAEGAQAYCLECPVPAAAQAPKSRDLGALARLLTLLGLA